jgi:hypothetical protein
MALPPDYLAALGNLAKAFAAYEAETGASAVLVGGAAAAIHTAGAFMSADFDIVAASDDAFARAMAAAGFQSDPKAGHGLGGWFHPDSPAYAVEQVSGGYFDGRGDKARCVKLVVRDGNAIVLPAIEDMIADRLGQHAVSGGDTAMLEQAKALFTMAEGLDARYLTRRIREEGGNPSLLGLCD